LNFEFEETNLFEFSKFSGVDRWEGGTRANVGFNHTVLFNDGKYIKFTAGESFQLYGKNSYGSDTGLDTDRSDFVTALQFKPSQYLNFTGRARLDESSGELRRVDINTTAHYGRVNTLVYFTDADSRPTLGQPKHRTEIYAEAGLQVTKYWNLFGKIRYDIRDNDRVTNAVGVRYDDECFVFHVQYKEDFTKDRDIDINRSIMFRFELKTITSSGS
jgi:LPS-assembly protein